MLLARQDLWPLPLIADAFLFNYGKCVGLFFSIESQIIDVKTLLFVNIYQQPSSTRHVFSSSLSTSEIIESKVVFFLL